MSNRTDIITESKKIAQYIEDENLDTTSRRRQLVYRRAYLYAYMHKVMHFPLSHVGEFFGKDHASVIHGIKNVYETFASDPLFIKYTVKEAELFPMDKMVIHKVERKFVHYEMTITEEAMKKLRQYKVMNKCDNIDDAIELLIHNSRK